MEENTQKPKTKKDVLFPFIFVIILFIGYLCIVYFFQIAPKNINIRNDKVLFPDIERVNDIRKFVTFLKNIEEVDTSLFLRDIASIDSIGIDTLSTDRQNNLKLGFLWLEVNNMKKEQFQSDLDIIYSFYHFPYYFLFVGFFFLIIFIVISKLYLGERYSWTLLTPYLMAWSGALFLLLATIFLWVTAPFFTPFTTNFALQGAALSIGVPMFMELIPYTYQKMKEKQASIISLSKENSNHDQNKEQIT